MTIWSNQNNPELVSPLFLCLVLIVVLTLLFQQVSSWKSRPSTTNTRLSLQQVRQARQRAAMAAMSRQEKENTNNSQQPQTNESPANMTKRDNDHANSLSSRAGVDESHEDSEQDGSSHMESSSRPSRKGPPDGTVKHEDDDKETREEESSKKEETPSMPKAVARAKPSEEGSIPNANKKDAHDDASENHDNKNQENIKKATLQDGVKWKEERASRAQFGGFSIYGHGTHDDACQECGGHGLVQNASIPTFSSGGCIHSIASISHLPMADETMATLQLLANEFEPVLRARGWTVVALTEMCCCGDGDEELSTETSSRQGPNVMGYCVSNGNGRVALGIHLRLRPPGSCKRGGALIPYRHVVSTMAHELAHVQYQNHSPQFYQVMADIERERLEYMGRGVVLNQDGFPAGSMGRKLGGGSSQVLGRRELKQQVAESASKRQRQGHVPQATPSPRKQARKKKRTDPSKREAQLRAAEKRRNTDKQD